MFGNSCNGIHRRINSVLIPIICAMNNEWIVINVIISFEELINKWYTELRKPQIGLSYMISCIQDLMLFVQRNHLNTQSNEISDFIRNGIANFSGFLV